MSFEKGKSIQNSYLQGILVSLIPKKHTNQKKPIAQPEGEAMI